MLKMMNPLGSVPSMPSVGEGKEDGLSREERLEQERANKEEAVRAEKERKQRYLKGREVSERRLCQKCCITVTAQQKQTHMSS